MLPSSSGFEVKYLYEKLLSSVTNRLDNVNLDLAKLISF